MAKRIALCWLHRVITFQISLFSFVLFSSSSVSSSHPFRAWSPPLHYQSPSLTLPPYCCSFCFFFIFYYYYFFVFFLFVLACFSFFLLRFLRTLTSSFFMHFILHRPPSSVYIIFSLFLSLNRFFSNYLFSPFPLFPSFLLPSCLSTFFNSLPVERAIVHESLVRGYLTIAQSSSNRKRKCWDYDHDKQRVIQTLKWIIKEMQLEANIHIHMLGASSGGGFVGKLCVESLEVGTIDLKISSAIVQIMPVRLPDTAHTRGLSFFGYIYRCTIVLSIALFQIFLFNISIPLYSLSDTIFFLSFYRFYSISLCLFFL